jgi:hypothetical protein
VVLRPCRVCCFSPSEFILSGRAVLVPSLVRAAAGCTLPSRSPFGLRRAIPKAVLLRTVATCCYCLALGSYVVISLALEALLQAANHDHQGYDNKKAYENISMTKADALRRQEGRCSTYDLMLMNKCKSEKLRCITVNIGLLARQGCSCIRSRRRGCLFA